MVIIHISMIYIIYLLYQVEMKDFKTAVSENLVPINYCVSKVRIISESATQELSDLHFLNP